jgi:hypothetical protein
MADFDYNAPQARPEDESVFGPSKLYREAKAGKVDFSTLTRQQKAQLVDEDKFAEHLGAIMGGVSGGIRSAVPFGQTFLPPYDVEKEHPIAAAVGSFAGYAMPGAIANRAAKALTPILAGRVGAAAPLAARAISGAGLGLATSDLTDPKETAINTSLTTILESLVGLKPALRLRKLQQAIGDQPERMGQTALNMIRGDGGAADIPLFSVDAPTQQVPAESLFDPRLSRLRRGLAPESLPGDAGTFIPEDQGKRMAEIQDAVNQARIRGDVESLGQGANTPESAFPATDLIPTVKPKGGFSMADLIAQRTAGQSDRVAAARRMGDQLRGTAAADAVKQVEPLASQVPTKVVRVSEERINQINKGFDKKFEAATKKWENSGFKGEAPKRESLETFSRKHPVTGEPQTLVRLPDGTVAERVEPQIKIVKKDNGYEMQMPGGSILEEQ